MVERQDLRDTLKGYWTTIKAGWKDGGKEPEQKEDK